MKNAKRTALGLIAGLLLASLPPTAPALAAKASWDCFRHKTSEQRFANKMNLARSYKGVRRMHLDKQLSRIARRHANSMAADNDLFHSSMSALGQKITTWDVLGENVGMGYGVESLHKAFMASPAHKANILFYKFRNVGIGTAKKNGTIFVTVVFQASSNPGTTLSPPTC